MTMLFHVDDYHYAMIFQRDKHRSAVLLKTKDELKMAYILSLGCFSDGLAEVRELKDEELVEVSKLKESSKDKNFFKYLEAFDKTKAMLDVVYFYTENDVILPDVLAKLESGIQVIAKKSEPLVVAQQRSQMKEDRWSYATKAL
jgi:hypothetical protein